LFRAWFGGAEVRSLEREPRFPTALVEHGLRQGALLWVQLGA
jgi:hypothetical protein